LPPRLELPGTTTELIDVDLGFSRFDLALELQLRPDGIGGYFEYNLALFKASSIERLAADFERLLTDVLADPDRMISTIALESAVADSGPKMKSFRGMVGTA
jgi:hypothetical protein